MLTLQVCLLLLNLYIGSLDGETNPGVQAGVDRYTVSHFGNPPRHPPVTQFGITAPGRLVTEDEVNARLIAECQEEGRRLAAQPGHLPLESK